MKQDERVPPEMIPLVVLVCDADQTASVLLKNSLSKESGVVDARIVQTLDGARAVLAEASINTVFVDPLSLGLEEASKFVFSIRSQDPEIVFVLYVDRLRAEQNRSDFYCGERHRFSHYYTLDKRTPILAFEDEVHAIVETCQLDLGWG
jgi:hypothetical protein